MIVIILENLSFNGIIKTFGFVTDYKIIPDIFSNMEHGSNCTKYHRDIIDTCFPIGLKSQSNSLTSAILNSIENRF